MSDYFEIDPAMLPINQCARVCYYADEAIRAVSYSRASKIAIPNSYALKCRITFEELKEKLMSGRVDAPYGVVLDGENI